MRKIIKDRRIIEDHFQLVSAEEILPIGHIIVPIARWRKERGALIAHAGRKGVSINGDDDLFLLIDDLPHFDLIAIEFPAYKDGRGYSHARLLRERYGFKKEIRAIGDVMRDQLYYMERCGINAYEVREDKSLQDALKAFNDFSVRYQAAADGEATPIL